MNREFFVGLLTDWGIALGIVVVVFLGWGWLSSPSPPQLGPAPAFSLPDLTGRVVTLDALDDDVAVLNFWFTSCPPCRHEIPELAAYHAAHPDVKLVGISVDRGMPTARLGALSKRLGINYPVLHDADAAVAHAFGVSVFPTTVLVRHGEVVTTWVGEVNRQQLIKLVEAARSSS